jgi:flagellar FliL protein
MPEGEKKSKNSRSGGSRWVVAVIPIVIVAGVVIWFWGNRGSDAATGEASRIRSTLHLETFVLNLADPDQRSYLRVGIDLGLNQDAKHEAQAPVAQVRDVILSVLGQAKLSDLMTVEGKKKLKEDLLHAVQERVPQLGVEEIYFTEFLIQR